MRILLIEDEEKLALSLQRGLAKMGYAVDILDDGEKALRRILLYRSEYDLAIVDLMLPSLNGVEICRQAREAGVLMPFLVLTARHEIDKKVEALNAGADDYVLKPFSFAELCARIQAIMRRPQQTLPTTLSAHGIELDPATRVAKKQDAVLALTLREFALLEYLMRNQGRALNREEIITNVWDFYFDGFSNVVDVYVKKLRKKLASKGEVTEVIETVRGFGYRFKE